MINRSYITQRMQNCFDYTDVRSRESSTSLEAQLLNLAGFELEDLIQRVDRELAQTLQTVPTNLDNGGGVLFIIITQFFATYRWSNNLY